MSVKKESIMQLFLTPFPLSGMTVPHLIPWSNMSPSSGIFNGPWSSLSDGSVGE
jgi:hypothetical protein